MLDTLSLVVVGFSFLLYYYLVLRLSIFGLRSKKWPTTRGEIIYSEIEKEKLALDTAVRRYRALVVYEYSISGRSYRNHDISAGEVTNIDKRWSGRNARLIGEKYPLAQEVTVYYHPEKPQRSLLEPGIDANLRLWLLIGFIILLLLATAAFYL